MTAIAAKRTFNSTEKRTEYGYLLGNHRELVTQYPMLALTCNAIYQLRLYLYAIPHQLLDYFSGTYPLSLNQSVIMK